MNATRAALDALMPRERRLPEHMQDFMMRWLTVAYGTLESPRSGEYTQALACEFEPMGIRLAH